MQSRGGIINIWVSVIKKLIDTCTYVLAYENNEPQIYKFGQYQTQNNKHSQSLQNKIKRDGFNNICLSFFQ